MGGMGGGTSEVGGTVCVGEPDPAVRALTPGALRVHLLRRGPLDHHEERRRASVHQGPGERHTGGVDDHHTEGAHADACQGTSRRGP